MRAELKELREEFSEVQGDREKGAAELMREQEEMDAMKVIRNRLGERGDNIVRGITDVD